MPIRRGAGCRSRRRPGAARESVRRGVRRSVRRGMRRGCGGIARHHDGRLLKQRRDMLLHLQFDRRTGGTRATNDATTATATARRRRRHRRRASASRRSRSGRAIRAGIHSGIPDIARNSGVLTSGLRDSIIRGFSVAEALLTQSGHDAPRDALQPRRLCQAPYGCHAMLSPWPRINCARTKHRSKSPCCDGGHRPCGKAAQGDRRHRLPGGLQNRHL